MRTLGFAGVIAGAVLAASVAQGQAQSIAIANFGDHPVLNLVVDEVKRAVGDGGYKDATFDVKHTNFDGALVPQMLEALAATKPDLMVVVTTPVAQTAKTVLANRGIPVIFTAITDPVDAGLVPSRDQPSEMMTGVSDKQNITAVFNFIKTLHPGAKTVGFPYNPGEPNDVVQLNEAKAAADATGLALAAVGVEAEGDLPVRVNSLKGKADVIYVPASNLVQSGIGTVSALARKMKMPLIDS